MRSGRLPGGSPDEQIRSRRLVPDAATNRLPSGRIRAKVVAADWILKCAGTIAELCPDRQQLKLAGSGAGVFDPW